MNRIWLRYFDLRQRVGDGLTSFLYREVTAPVWEILAVILLANVFGEAGAWVVSYAIDAIIP